MYDTIKIQVRVILPWHREPIEKWVEIHPNTVGAALMPLPRDRELPFAFDSIKIAQQQKLDRHKTARMIADILAESIMDAIESRDPINGYSPEEWRRMHA